MSAQPGYNELAYAYDEAFPTGYTSAVERHAVAIFADNVKAAGPSGPVVDVGCGTGHIAYDLSARGLDVVGLDPSTAMLSLAQQRYPDMRWLVGDATLSQLPGGHPALAGIIARFSLIHVDPETLPIVLNTWVELLQPSAQVMVAFQCSADPAQPVRKFDHRVARAWRWHPDAMAAAMRAAGLTERWRLVTQPDDKHRFAECHLVCDLAA